jgi:hypothetical protein
VTETGIGMSLYADPAVDESPPNEDVVVNAIVSLLVVVESDG